MRKFKLIKNFCGSGLKEGDIITFQKNETAVNYGNMPFFHVEFTLSEVEKYPENWEELIEKDYEILSFKSDCGCIANIQLDGKYSSCKINKRQKGHYTVKKMLNLDCIRYYIHSIKRVSDGEIFTVGDQVKTSISNNYCSIYEFRLNNTNKLVIECTHSYLAYIKNVDLLKDMQHLKKPLFTTEDGVDLYKGDKYFQIGCRFDNIECEAYDENNFAASLIIFSTKEGAEEYILMNKPYLSLKDIQTYFSSLDNNYQYHTTSLNNLINLVKEKKSI